MTHSSNQSFHKTVLTVLQHRYGKRHGPKILAGHAEVSHRTAEGWLSGRSVPTGVELIKLMAENDLLVDEILRLVEQHKQQRGTQ